MKVIQYYKYFLVALLVAGCNPKVVTNTVVDTIRYTFIVSLRNTISVYLIVSTTVLVTTDIVFLKDTIKAIDKDTVVVGVKEILRDTIKVIYWKTKNVFTIDYTKKDTVKIPYVKTEYKTIVEKEYTVMQKVMFALSFVVVGIILAIIIKVIK